MSVPGCWFKSKWWLVVKWNVFDVENKHMSDKLVQPLSENAFIPFFSLQNFVSWCGSYENMPLQSLAPRSISNRWPQPAVFWTYQGISADTHSPSQMLLLASSQCLSMDISGAPLLQAVCFFWWVFWAWGCFISLINLSQNCTAVLRICRTTCLPQASELHCLKAPPLSLSQTSPFIPQWPIPS